MDIIIKQNNGVIEENFTEAKAYLQQQLDAYKGVVFTEDTKKDAKETIANLRKDKKALQDKVKAVKVEYMRPFEEFQRDYETGFYEREDSRGKVRKKCKTLQTLLDTLEMFPEHREELLEMFNYKMSELLNESLWK